MRIEAYNKIDPVYKTGKTSKITKTAETGSTARDEVSISSLGYDYQIAKQAVADASDIREDKVAKLKGRVDSGNYHVNTNDFANKLLEKYNALYT